MQHLKQTQSGRSMIEMLAVLAIIGIISIGAIAALNQAMVKYRTTRTYTEIRAINQNIANLYSYTRTYPSPVNMQTLCENEVFPTECRPESGQQVARNPFGGTYTVEFADNVMTISATNIPSAACTELQNQTWGRYFVEGTTLQCSGNGAIKTFSVTLY